MSTSAPVTGGDLAISLTVVSPLRYYLEHPYTLSGKWRATLHRGGKEGEELGKIEKGGLKSDKEITMA